MKALACIPLNPSQSEAINSLVDEDKVAMVELVTFLVQGAVL